MALLSQHLSQHLVAETQRACSSASWSTNPRQEQEVSGRDVNISNPAPTASSQSCRRRQLSESWLESSSHTTALLHPPLQLSQAEPSRLPSRGGSGDRGLICLSSFYSYIGDATGQPLRASSSQAGRISLIPWGWQGNGVEADEMCQDATHCRDPHTATSEPRAA